MKETYFHIVVNKLRNYTNKIITLQKVKNIVHAILDDKYSDAKAYKTLYHLKNKGYAISIKKDLILIKSPKEQVDDEQIAQKYYRPVLKLQCRNAVGNQWYIGGIKALELLQQNYDIPDEIEVYTKKKNGTEVVLLDKKIVFKTYNQDKKNLRPLFAKFTTKIIVRNHSFNVARLEVALLESLYNTPILQKAYVVEMVKKVLRKQKKGLDLGVFRDILRAGKHHASINRLYYIAKGIDEELAEKIGEVIKKHSFVLAREM